MDIKQPSYKVGNNELQLAFVVAAAHQCIAGNVNHVGGVVGTPGADHPGRGNHAASEIQVLRMLCK